MELPVFDFSPVPQNCACTGRVAHNTLAFGFFLTILEKSFGFLPKLSHVLLEDSSTLGNAMDSNDGNHDLWKCNSFAESHILSHMDTCLSNISICLDGTTNQLPEGGTPFASA